MDKKSENVFGDPNVRTKVTKCDKITTCNLYLKTELREFEHQFVPFSSEFIRKRLSKWLPIFKTIQSCDDVNPIVKYVIYPDGTAKVIYLGKKIIRKNGEPLTVGSIIRAREVKRPNFKNNEYCIYNYSDVIRVKGTAKCAEGDVYNEGIGTVVATTKAANSAAKIYRKVTNEIISYLNEAEQAIGNSAKRIETSSYCTMNEVLNTIGKE